MSISKWRASMDMIFGRQSPFLSSMSSKYWTKKMNAIARKNYKKQIEACLDRDQDAYTTIRCIRMIFPFVGIFLSNSFV